MKCTYYGFIISIGLLMSCGGNKKVVQATSQNKIPSTMVDTIPQDKETPLTTDPVVEAPIEIEEVKEIPAMPVEAFIHTPWTKLLQKHVSENGNVNYKGFKQDTETLRLYLKELAENIPNEDWSKPDELAYWLNVYNAFTIKLIIDHYPLKSIKEIENLKKPWDHRFIKIGKKWYTLNDIEHKILRKMNDPRIHFGINCASVSCPPIFNKAFTAQNVDKELERLTFDFINDPDKNSITPNQIRISKIFSWFANDFKSKGTLIDFLNTYSKIKIERTAKKSFKKYDWNLNE